MYKIIITSNSSNGREYENKSRNALKMANEYGRCEGGEVVSVYRGEKLVSQARWTPENGGRYYRATI